jgi:hypothetical protein
VFEGLQNFGGYSKVSEDDRYSSKPPVEVQELGISLGRAHSHQFLES